MAKPCFLTWFSHGFSAWQFLSVSGLLIAATTWYFGFFQLSVTRFACDIGQSAKIWICVSSEVIIICSAFSGLFANQPITSLLATPRWRDPTRSKQLFKVAIRLFSVFYTTKINGTARDLETKLGRDVQIPCAVRMRTHNKHERAWSASINNRCSFY